MPQVLLLKHDLRFITDEVIQLRRQGISQLFVRDIEIKDQVDRGLYGIRVSHGGLLRIGWLNVRG